MVTLLPMDASGALATMSTEGAGSHSICVVASAVPQRIVYVRTPAVEALTAVPVCAGELIVEGRPLKLQGATVADQLIDTRWPATACVACGRKVTACGGTVSVMSSSTAPPPHEMW